MTLATVGRHTWWAVLLVLAIAMLGGCSSATSIAEPATGATGGPAATSTKEPTGASAGIPDPGALAPQRATTELPTIAVAQLPAQGVQTLELIADGGPFPYERDGVTFGNRERILPERRNGFYREYTVVTPGSKDRGARRIVAGQDGSRFYTDDHYDSFREVVAQ